MADPPTSDRMRHDISRGKTGDKIDHPDPAAAPLGTDDEAAGKPPSTEELRMASANMPTKLSPKEEAFGVVGVYVFIFIVIVAAVITVALSPR